MHESFRVSVRVSVHGCFRESVRRNTHKRRRCVHVNSCVRKKHSLKKEMKKIPKGLSEYGFTTEEIINIAIEAVKEIEDLTSLEINE